MKNILFPLIFFISITLHSQSVTISGSIDVTPSAQEYYEASFDYSLNINTNVSWSVVGGTIISQSINPSNTIWCVIEWNNDPCAGSLQVEEDLGSGYNQINVDVGHYSNILSIVGSPSSRGTLNCTL